MNKFFFFATLGHAQMKGARDGQTRGSVEAENSNAELLMPSNIKRFIFLCSKNLKEKH